MRKCEVEGCDGKHVGRGYCKKHYTRYYRYGDPKITKREIHGLSKLPEYITWMSIKARCYNKNVWQFYRYGGRGIIVCDKWKHSFVAFYKDMGNKPFDRAEIDRIDNDGNYGPSNCRWVTPMENKRNTMRIKLTINKAEIIRKLAKSGKYTRKELAVKYEVSISSIDRVINNEGWALI